MAAWNHDIRVVFGEGAESGAGLRSHQVEEFDVSCDMLELADEFSLTVPVTPKLWDVTRPDSLVAVYVDDSQILSGFVDERDRVLTKEGGSAIQVRGRDKGGRLIDESAPLVTYEGQGIQDLARDLVSDWFPTVSLSNAKNRALVKGRGRRSARIAAEPPIVADRRQAKKTEPGETRASVLLHFLERGNLLAWSSADGREFIVGKPNHEQAPQWFFFAAGSGSARKREVNVRTLTYRESVMDRYSSILVVGTSRGDDTNWGPNTTKRRAKVEGTGFQRQKRLTIAAEDLRTTRDAQDRAELERRRRDATGIGFTVGVAGFGQALGGAPGTRPSLFACDTIARYEDEETGVSGDFLVTRVRFRRSRADGNAAELTMVPRGTELAVR